MGRFGNVLLVNGEERLEASVALGEVVRLHLVNTANTRIFNVAIPDAQMKLVGGDSGRYQRETFVEEVLPRAVGARRSWTSSSNEPAPPRSSTGHPDRVYDLGAFTVVPMQPTRFADLRVGPRADGPRRPDLDADRERAPDKTLAFRSTMPLLYGNEAGAASAYACPMHPEVDGIASRRAARSAA